MTLLQRTGLVALLIALYLGVGVFDHELAPELATIPHRTVRENAGPDLFVYLGSIPGPAPEISSRATASPSGAYDPPD